MCVRDSNVRVEPAVSGRWRRRALLLSVTILTVTPGSAVSQSCSVSSTGVAFGSYDSLVANATAPLDATGTVSYLCNRRVPVTITLSTGPYGTFAARQLARAGSPADRLTYNLYRDAARSVVWGDRSLGVGHYYTGTARRNRTMSVPLFGRIAASQDAVPGTYTSQLIISLEY